MTKEEIEVMLKKIQNKEATEEEVNMFLTEVGKLLDEVIAVAK